MGGSKALCLSAASVGRHKRMTFFLLLLELTKGSKAEQGVTFWIRVTCEQKKTKKTPHI